MRRNMEKFFRLELTDYATPGFCSLTKPYYGSLNDVISFIERINSFNLDCDPDELQMALSKYMAGNKRVKHHTVSSNVNFLNKVELLEKRLYSLYNLNWQHINIWNCPYNLRASGVEVEEVLIKDKEKYSRCAKLKVYDLKLQSPLSSDSWSELIDGFWGFPAMIYYDKKTETVNSSLYYRQKVFEDFNEAENDFINNGIVFDGFCDDIFGDG